MLILETNTYALEAFAIEYAAAAGLEPLAEAELSLKRATLGIDRLYGARFIGTKTTGEQLLMWPRRPAGPIFDITPDWYLVDSFGNYRNFTELPVELSQATVELAVMIEAGEDIYAQSAPFVVSDTLKVDVIELSQTYQRGYQVSSTSRIALILAPLLAAPGQIRLVR